MTESREALASDQVGDPTYLATMERLEEVRRQLISLENEVDRRVTEWLLRALDKGVNS